jgi:hypothetical protein
LVVVVVVEVAVLVVVVPVVLRQHPTMRLHLARVTASQLVLEVLALRAALPVRVLRVLHQVSYLVVQDWLQTVAVVVFNMVRIRPQVGLQVQQRVPVRSHRMPEELDENTEPVVHQLTGVVVAVVVRAVQELQQ